jgi:hypothetical protein
MMVGVAAELSLPHGRLAPARFPALPAHRSPRGKASPVHVCAQPGCPALTEQRRCPTHTRAQERARGTRTARGYGPQHVALRAQWAPLVATGLVQCHRPGCPYLIPADAPWDLGHNDTDRSRYQGPEHRACNRAGRPAYSPTPSPRARPDRTP